MKSQLHIFFILFISAGLIALSCLSVNGQNPFDIEQRKIDVQNANSTINEYLDNNESFQNPFDVNKTVNRQKSEPKAIKEIKRNVNASKMGKPIKVFFLLLGVIAFVFIRNINLKGFQMIGKSIFNYSQLVEYRNSVNGLLNTQLGLFYIFFFLNAAYFLFLCVEKGIFNLPKLLGSSFVTAIIIVVSIYIVKYLTLMIIEYTLSIRRAISNHLFSISLHNIVLGFVLFFINTFYAFTSGQISTTLMYLGFISVMLFYLIRQVKGLQFISDMRHINIFHFFIYLCSCEISPLLVAIKFVTG